MGSEVGGQVVPDQCDKVFKDTYLRRTHIMVAHTDERPFVCDECGYRSAYKAGLKSHKAIHER